MVLPGEPLGNRGYLEVVFQWPSSVANKKWLLYLSEIQMTGTSKPFCVPENNIINPLNLNVSDKMLIVTDCFSAVRCWWQSSLAQSSLWIIERSSRRNHAGTGTSSFPRTILPTARTAISLNVQSRVGIISEKVYLLIWSRGWFGDYLSLCAYKSVWHVLSRSRCSTNKSKNSREN